MRLPSSCHLLEETKRVSRILELTQLIALQPNTHLRRGLANRFEISERMIQKDLDVIRHGLKFPLAHSPKGYFFEETPRIPALRLTFPEALALCLAINASRNLHGLHSPELLAALGRLEALFSPDFCSLLRQASTGGFNAANGVKGDHRGKMLLLLSHALAQNRKVRIIYRTLSRRDQIHERIVHPYHLMPYVRSWQLIAYCELREEVRMFKVDRIMEASLLDQQYRLPDDFRLDDYLGLSWGIIRGQSDVDEQVVLRFEAEAGHRVAEEFWHKTQSVEELSDGRIVFRVHAVVTPELVHWILYHGCRVEVLTPAWLRDRVAEEHRKAAELNSTCLGELDG